MNFWAKLFAAVLATVAVSGCATTYGPMQLTGGYEEKELEPGIWRVLFSGNGYTTTETAQTFWLYRCAELAKSKGYDGFRILTPINLTQLPALRGETEGRAVIIKAHSSGGSFTTYSYSYSQMPKPSFSGDIQLIRKPIASSPGKVFDATILMAALEPYVKGALCNGNVCPHVHRYLYSVPPSDAPLAPSPSPAEKPVDAPSKPS